MCVPVQEVTGENRDPGCMDSMSKLLASVCPVTGGIHSVHVYVLLCARKSVLVEWDWWVWRLACPGVSNWGNLVSTASYWMDCVSKPSS